jgi:nuclear pore complex protein Nup155
MVAGSKIEEVANQAEHRMLHALVTLVQGMIEGISFVLFLFDDKLTEIVLSLEGEHREMIGSMTYGNLFATPQGQNLAKELVTAIVNRNIAAGLSVDTITDTLRRRCGNFCSADDVIVFKALEQVKKAKTETDPDIKNRLLRESLRLFEETAASLTMDNLADMVTQFRNLDYYPGAVQLALVVAREADRGNLALQFLTEPPTVQTDTADLYFKCIQCYQLIFRVLEDLDQTYGRAPEMIDGVPTSTTRLRNETWNLIYNSDDELFHYQLYDWLFSRGEAFAERLLEIDSPYVLGYLQYRGAESLDHCELLYQYHARRDNFYQSALVLHELAISEFPLTLEKRLEFFSRARGFCQSSYSTSRKQVNELSQQLQEELDVAVIQDDLLKRLREDVRISQEKKNKLELALGKKILSLSEVFTPLPYPPLY